MEHLAHPSPTLDAEQVALRAKHYDEAKAQGLLLVRIDPKTIRATKFRNRSDLSLLIHDPKFIKLTKSIAARGQDTPIRVRPVQDAPPFEFEIVSGHRRHAACLALDASTNHGFPIISMVDPAACDTLDLVRKMYRENDAREPLSAHETGTGQSKQNVGRYIALASLPDYLLSAFRDPRLLSLRWSTELTAACETRESELKSLASDLAKRIPPPSPEAVFKELLTATPKKQSKRTSESIKRGNKVLFKLSARKGLYGIQLGKQVDKGLHKPLQHDLKEWLQAWLKQHAPESPK